MADVTWADVVIAIPAMLPERTASTEALLRQVASACPKAPILLRPCVRGEPARGAFPDLMDAAASVGRSWILYLEDDAVLAPTFGSEALAHGLGASDCVTYFSRRADDLTLWERGLLVRWRSPRSLSGSVGLLMRREVAAAAAWFAPTFYARHPEHQRAADLLLGECLAEMHGRLAVRLPSLVQHRGDLPSTLPNRRGARQSEMFRRAFGDVS